MRKWSWLLGTVVLLGLALNVTAQEEIEYRDIAEVSVYGGLALPAQGISDFRDTLGAKTGWEVGLSAGLFVTPDFVVGLDFTYSQYSIDTDNDLITLDHRFYNPMLYAKYYFFGESDFVPYLKASAGLFLPKFTTPVMDDDGTNLRLRELSYGPGLSVGGAAGIMMYVHDYGGLFLEASYQQAFTEDADKTLGANTYVFGENTGLVNIQFGISAFFGNE
jgi:hypothetical protein